MTAAAIKLEELLVDNEVSTRKWQAWFANNPAALDVPCAIYNSGTVRGLLKHIFAVELRHSQRLLGEEVTSLRRNSCWLVGGASGRPCASDEQSSQVSFKRK